MYLNINKNTSIKSSKTKTKANDEKTFESKPPVSVRINRI